MYVFYAPEYDGGILWNDPAIGINWQIPEAAIQLSEKDTQHPLLKDISHFDYASFSGENVYK
ncbi:dTDP-4-dehydrorhamnose 3,5-epimerase family protein [Draconibacterium mangrovi]|uniref:dTDP-4-dehydrorhamnose 3,5-epimerase family protein n=1 Tax=Draconibacterium mangrovi TaxID=2697469 RepID=UPI0013D300F2|nr:dTDP-4-dehydrorhamnose 3,5-epimerase family protein [Draconibacterium mangrovi]